MPKTSRGDVGVDGIFTCAEVVNNVFGDLCVDLGYIAVESSFDVGVVVTLSGGDVVYGFFEMLPRYLVKVDGYFFVFGYNKIGVDGVTIVTEVFDKHAYWPEGHVDVCGFGGVM